MLPSLSRSLLAGVGFAAAAAAQCATAALPGSALPGPATGSVHAAVGWDPDGPGPLQERLVIGGEFTMPSIGANNIACYDYATRDWQALGAGTSHRVNALAVLPGGDLVATGGFLSAGGTNAFAIARWDGANWHPIGNGLPGGGNAMVVMPNGDLVVGCWSATGQPNLVRWNGAAWSQFAGYVDNSVNAIALAQNGDIYIGGTFVYCGGVFTSRVARWDGAAWHHLAFGISGAVSRLVVQPNGDLIVGGSFLFVGFPQVAAARIARWDGAAWSPLAGGSSLAISALQQLPNGDLAAAGLFAPAGVPAFNLGRWDGAQWTPIGIGTTQPALGFHVRGNGELVAVGEFDRCDAAVAGKVARHDGVGWRALGDSPDNRVHALAVDAQGDVHVAGTFRIAGGVRARGLARLQAGGWAPATVAGNAYYQDVSSIVPLADGRLAATRFGGLSQRMIALWDGGTWTPTAATVDHDVHAIAQRGNGEIVIGGSFRVAGSSVAKLVGNTWQPIGTQFHGNAVRSLLVTSGGDVVAGGDLLIAGATTVNHVMRWDGTAWQAMGAGLGTGYYDTVRCLVQLRDGSIVAGGTFTVAGQPALSNLARFDGAAWQPLGSGLLGGSSQVGVQALLVLENGDLLVGGSFTTAGGVPARGLARWAGGQWSAVDPGVEGSVHALVQLPDGDLLVGGDFARAGAMVSAHLARIRSACVARADPVGVGCTNGLGQVELVTRRLPWLGGTYRATCDQASPAALGFAVRGFGQVAVPLSLYDPVAGPGCLQLVSQDSVVWLFPEGSRVTSSIAVPAAAGLLGVQVLDQVVIAELSPALAITGLSSSNALRLVIGTF